MAKNTETAVVPFDQYEVATLDPKEVVRVIRDNVGDRGVTQFELEQIKIPAGGSCAWEVPDLEGPSAANDFAGVIIHYRDSRRYWAESF